ncbi:MAG: hypothetical protein ABI371_00875 [Gelidibacter sp.]
MKNQDKKSDKRNQSDSKKSNPEKGKEEAEKKDFPGYPHYPASEDIYNREKETDLNPDDLTKKKSRDDNPGKRNEKDFYEDMTGEDLDVPGSKADQAKSNAGSEDEENNYYSLGGDNHKDLEEDKG